MSTTLPTGRKGRLEKTRFINFCQEEFVKVSLSKDFQGIGRNGIKKFTSV